MPKQQHVRIIKEQKETFNKIVQTSGITDTDTPLNAPGYDDLSLEYPYSRITCFLVQLYSLELGCPPLYSEFNKAARNMDLKYLRTLGPYA